MSYIVRSIDLGYGTTKYTSRELSDGYECKSFESVAVVVPMKRLNTELSVFTIPVNDLNYAVGDDTYKLTALGDVRPKHEDYVQTDEYKALMKGALRAMNVDRIDMLVLGLPVRIHPIKCNQLMKDWKGVHKLGDGKTVTVRNVLVVMQPLGGYWAYREYARHTKGDTFNGRTLIVDPGWHTLDWLVGEGSTYIESATKSKEMGVSGMLQCVADTISRARTDDLPFPTDPSLAVVDGWIRKGEIDLYAGRIKTPIAPYLSTGNDFVRKAVNHMYSSIAEKELIRDVVVVGGAAQLYYPFVKDVFKHMNVEMPPDPIYANVRGYQLLGMSMLQKHLESRKTG